MGLDGDGAELRVGWAGGAQEDFHARGRARMAGAGVTRITAAVSRVRTAEAEQGWQNRVCTPTIRTYRVVEINNGICNSSPGFSGTTVASPSYERVSTSLFDGNAASPIFMVRIGKGA